MKKYIFIIASLLIATASSAQQRNPMTAEQRAQASTQELRQALELDDAQYAKIYKVYLKQARREDKRAAQAEADLAATKLKIKHTLSAEQAQRWEQMESAGDVFTPRKGAPGGKIARIQEKGDPKRNRNMYIEP